jgi:hypothetical protein
VETEFAEAEDSASPGPGPDEAAGSVRNAAAVSVTSQAGSGPQETRQFIDKSVLALPEPRRIRDRDHLRNVAAEPCLVCGRRPAQAHHLKFAQVTALSRKVSDEFTVPLCLLHHRELHEAVNERDWWARRNIDPLAVAHELWARSRPHRKAAMTEIEESRLNGSLEGW